MTALNHTVPFVPDTIETPCRGCSAVLLVAPHAEPPHLCRACRKSQQDNEAYSIVSAVRALAAGEAPLFDLLTLDERRVYLRQLATAVAYARVQLAESDAEVDAILAGPVAKSAAVAFEHYQSLGDEPSDAEKAAIYEVEEILDREETLAREANAGWL